MHCILWKILVVSTENKFLFEDSFNVLFVRIIFLWFFMVFIMAYLWKGFSCGFYDFLHAIFVVMVFVVFSNNPLWFLWFLWFLWSSTFYSSRAVVLFRPDAVFDTVPNYTNLHPHGSNEEECFNQSPITDCSLISHHMLKYVHFNKNITHYNL